MLHKNSGFNTDVQEIKYFDLGRLEKLSQGNSNILEDMLLSFIYHIPDAVDEMRQALQARDYSSIEYTAARIQPVLGYYEITPAIPEIQWIRHLAGKKSTGSLLEEKIENLSETVRVVSEELKRKLFIHQN